MQTAEDVLEHFGVRGMKWGVTRNRIDSSSEDAQNATAAKLKVRKSGTKALSNKELQALVTRMNLEQQFNRLNSPSKGTQAAKFVADILLTVGKQEATKFVAGHAARQVAKLLTGIG